MRETGDALRAREQVGLGQDEAVRDGRLFDGLLLRVEGCHAVDGVDEGHHAVETEPHEQIRVIHDRVENRRGIGEARGLDDDALEIAHAAVVATPQQIFQRGDQIATDGAAQAARGHEQHVAIGGLDQQMIESDLAELVDDDHRVGEGRIFQKRVEQRALAGAEEAGDHGEREGRRGPPRNGRFAHPGMRLSPDWRVWPQACAGPSWPQVFRQPCPMPSVQAWRRFWQLA